MSRNTLIVQFKCEGTLDDFDFLCELEDVLIQGFSQNQSGIVDGHDFGSRTMNIFIFPSSSWTSAIETVKAHLKNRNVLNRAVIAKRLKGNQKCTVIWPPGFNGAFSV